MAVSGGLASSGKNVYLCMIMDIDLLSRMVGELIVEHDQVGLPGVGTFVAGMVPASFSDKGFTINPPYRRLSFTPKCLEDKLLIDLYASTNPSVSHEAAATYITQFLSEMKAVLKQRKGITLPGLGRLRTTRENAIFFVPEEGLDIFPGGIGLRPVSLKSHVTQPDDPVVINVPLPVPEPEPIPEPVPEPDPVPEEIPGQAGNEGEKAGDDGEKAGNDGDTVTPTPDASDEPDRQGLSAAFARAGSEERSVAPIAEERPLPSGRKKRRWWIPVVAVAGAAVLALAVFLILARVAPDFIDSILYTPEELRIINY